MPQVWKMGQVGGKWGILSRFHKRFTLWEISPISPISPKWGKFAWGRITPNGEEKMGQARKNGASWGDFQKPEMPQTAKKSYPNGAKNVTDSGGCPILRKWGKRGGNAPSWGDSGLGSEIQKGIPCCFLIGFHRFGILFHLHCRTGSRIANSMVSQENLPNMPQISRFGSFFLPTWGKFWKWGKLKEMGHVGEIGEIQRKFQMSLKPILFLHKWGKIQGWGKMPHFRKTGFPEKKCPIR